MGDTPSDSNVLSPASNIGRTTRTQHQETARACWMTYLWIPSLAIDVTLHEGRPLAFVGHGYVHRVAWIARRWRVDVAW